MLRPVTKQLTVRPHDLPMIVAAVALSCAAGVAVAVLPLLASVISAGVAAFVLILAATRAVLSPTRDPFRADVASSSRNAATDRAHVARDARVFAAPRRLYYLGLLTIGLLLVRPAMSFTLSDWLFLASLLTTIVVVVRTRSAVGRQLPTGVILGAALFALGGLISSTQAVAPMASAAVVIRVLYLIVPWFWLGAVLLRTSANVHTAVNAWVVSAALCSFGAIIQFAAGDVVPGGDISYGRATGLTGQFNDLGGVAAVTFVPALMLAARARGTMRVVNSCALTLVGAGLLFSGSVGALLAAAASTAVWVAAGRRARSTVVLLLILIVAAAAFIQLDRSGSPSPLERVSSVTQADAPQARGGSLYSRIDVYRSAWDQIASQPLVGVGLDPESTARRLDFQVHNLVLQPWFTAGILGIAGILVLLGSLIHTGLYVLRAARDTDDLSLAVSLHASFLAFVVFAMSQPVLYVRYGWVSAALLIALRAQHVRLGADRRPTQPDDSRRIRAPARVMPAR